MVVVEVVVIDLLGMPGGQQLILIVSPVPRFINLGQVLGSQPLSFLLSLAKYFPRGIDKLKLPRLVTFDPI